MGSLPLWQSHGLPLATRNQGFGLKGLEAKKKMEGLDVFGFPLTTKTQQAQRLEAWTAYKRRKETEKRV
ncbi:hypothetical protein Tco_0377075 [Tanacetum coccineum]